VQIPVCMSAPAAAAHIVGGLFGLGCLLASYYQLTSQEPLTTADIPLQASIDALQPCSSQPCCAAPPHCLLLAAQGAGKKPGGMPRLQSEMQLSSTQQVAGHTIHAMVSSRRRIVHRECSTV
jgi:hypothetical protein